MIQIITTPKKHSVHVVTPFGKRPFKNSTAGRAQAYWYAAGLQDGLNERVTDHATALMITTEVHDQLRLEGTITR